MCIVLKVPSIHIFKSQVLFLEVKGFLSFPYLKIFLRNWQFVGHKIYNTEDAVSTEKTSKIPKIMAVD